MNLLTTLEKSVKKEDALILFVFRLAFLLTVGTGLKLIKTSISLSAELREAYEYKNMSCKNKNLPIILNYLKDCLRSVIAKEFMPFMIKEIKNEKKRFGPIEFNIKINEQS